MNKKIIFLIMATFLAISGVMAQTVSLSASPAPAAPGAVEVTVNMSDFATNAAAVTLFIDIDSDLLTLTGFEGLVGSSGGNLLVNSGPDNDYIMLSWLNFSGGNINGDFARLIFTYTGAFDTDLSFISYCEVTDLNSNYLARLNPAPQIGTFTGTTITAKTTPSEGTVKLGTDQAIAGEMAIINLSMNGFAGSSAASAAEFRIGYNPVQLNFLNVIDNTLGLMVNVSNGVITLSNNSMIPVSFPSETVVAKLRFTYLGGGTADLEFMPGSYVANNMAEYLITGFEDGYVERDPDISGKLVIEKVISTGATIDPTPPETVIPAFEQVTVTASDFPVSEEVGAMTLKIAYEGDPDLLQYVSYIPGTMTGWSFAYEPGLLTFTKTDMNGFIPDGIILTINFNYFYVPNPLVNGLVNITFEPGTLLQEPGLAFLPVELVDGYIGTGYELDVKVFLEGPYMATTGLMNPFQNIPLLQPYASAPWNYTGTEQVVTIPPDVVDWVYVELREADLPENATTIVWTGALFLTTSGQLTSIDGITQPIVSIPAPVQNLYIVIRHRNHVGIMSNFGLTLNSGVLTYDFTSPAGQAYKEDPDPLVFSQKDLNSSSIYGMFAGDVTGSANYPDIPDQNGEVNTLDLFYIFSNYDDLGYQPGDLDGDGEVGGLDMIKAYFNTNISIGAIIPN